MTITGKLGICKSPWSKSGNDKAAASEAGTMTAQLLFPSTPLDNFNPHFDVGIVASSEPVPIQSAMTYTASMVTNDRKAIAKAISLVRYGAAKEL
jgi:hypothetical protein